MKINPSTAKNQCAAIDEDCAPPIRCELEANHEGEHQWSGRRNAHERQEDGSYKTGEEKFSKKFTTATPPAQPPPGPPVQVNIKRASSKDVLPNSKLETSNS